MIDCLAVALGGAAGSVLRYLIGLIPVKEQFLFPIKTFAINVLGCFVIGYKPFKDIQNKSIISPKRHKASTHFLRKCLLCVLKHAYFSFQHKTPFFLSALHFIIKYAYAR